jgi:asparagine synthase (glutamine-hydrolysing)
LPEKIAQRTDKKGFVTPGEIKWLRGPLKHLLATENLTHLGDLCNLDKVHDLIREFDKGDNSNAQMVWRLVALNEWRKTIPQS